MSAPALLSIAEEGTVATYPLRSVTWLYAT